MLFLQLYGSLWDIPDEVYAKIKKQVDLHHRSINSEVIVYFKKLVQSNRQEQDQIITREFPYIAINSKDFVT